MSKRSINSRVCNNSLKPTAYACHTLCGKGKARATLRRPNSTVLHTIKTIT